MKYVIISILALMIISCNKEVKQEEISTQPVLIKVEAVHIGGDSLTSPIVLAR
jgi:hypothetical protein